jgi:hypothetical protein
VRLPRSVAWLLVALTFFTAGLLRQFHDSIPVSPYVPTVVGSLLFAAIVFLTLVAFRERQVGAVRGSGVRLGSLTPLLLMLLIEKWVSIALYNPAFYFLGSEDTTPEMLDARYRTFAGAGLLAVCLVLALFSRPATQRTWRLARTRHIPIALVATIVIVVGTYTVLWSILELSGRSFRLVCFSPRCSVSRRVSACATSPPAAGWPSDSPLSSSGWSTSSSADRSRRRAGASSSRSRSDFCSVWWS